MSHLVTSKAHNLTQVLLLCICPILLFEAFLATLLRLLNETDNIYFLSLL